MVEYAAWMFIHDTRIRKKLKNACAVSEDTAKTIHELDLSGPEKRRLQQLASIGKVKEITDKKGEKRYYVPCENEK
jgi:hypothetical protein